MATLADDAVATMQRAIEEIEGLRSVNAALAAALQEIADGCMNLRPGHVDYHKNRTKAQIEQIALAALREAA